MNLRKESGFVGPDISIAIIILTILVPVLTGIIYDVNKTSNQNKRKTDVLNIAINVLEIAKGVDLQELDVESNSDSAMVGKIKAQYKDFTRDDEKITVEDFPDDEIFDGVNVTINDYMYKVTIKSDDYSKTNTEADENIVKTITVIVEYQLSGKTESVQLQTLAVRI